MQKLGTELLVCYIALPCILIALGGKTHYFITWLTAILPFSFGLVARRRNSFAFNRPKCLISSLPALTGFHTSRSSSRWERLDTPLVSRFHAWSPPAALLWIHPLLYCGCHFSPSSCSFTSTSVNSSLLYVYYLHVVFLKINSHWYKHCSLSLITT